MKNIISFDICLKNIIAHVFFFRLLRFGWSRQGASPSGWLPSTAGNHQVKPARSLKKLSLLPQRRNSLLPPTTSSRRRHWAAPPTPKSTGRRPPRPWRRSSRRPAPPPRCSATCSPLWPRRAPSTHRGRKRKKLLPTVRGPNWRAPRPHTSLSSPHSSQLPTR